MLVYLHSVFIVRFMTIRKNIQFTPLIGIGYWHAEMAFSWYFFCDYTNGISGEVLIMLIFKNAHTANYYNYNNRRQTGNATAQYFRGRQIKPMKFNQHSGIKSLHKVIVWCQTRSKNRQKAKEQVRRLRKVKAQST